MMSKVTKVESQATARQMGVTSATIWNKSSETGVVEASAPPTCWEPLGTQHLPHEHERGCECCCEALGVGKLQRS